MIKDARMSAATELILPEQPYDLLDRTVRRDSCSLSAICYHVSTSSLKSLRSNGLAPGHYSPTGFDIKEYDCTSGFLASA